MHLHFTITHTNWHNVLWLRAMPRERVTPLSLTDVRRNCPDLERHSRCSHTLTPPGGFAHTSRFARGRDLGSGFSMGGLGTRSLRRGAPSTPRRRIAQTW